MPRIFVNECKQEVSSFNPVLGRYADFAIARGEEIRFIHHGVGSEVGGALSVFAEYPEIDVVPGYSARAITSGGTLRDEDFLHIAREFLDAVRNARNIDAIYFSLHGAFASETEHDIEGYLLAETRKIVGERMPVVTSLDLHGILTGRMAQHCDAIVLYHTYPHVDFFQTGERAARLLLRILKREVNPVSARVPIPAIVRGNELKTATGLFGQCVRKAIAVETGPGGLSGGVFIGNPFTDVPDLGSNVFLVTDGDAELAEREAVRIATDFWEMRQHLQQPLTELRESVRLAAAATGHVVLVDAADATSSGASGDSNAILRALLEAGYRRSVLLPVVDAPAVEQAFRAGVGKTIRVPIGGTLDRGRFSPVELEARVRMLSDGRFRNESHGGIWNSGSTAVLESDNITLVVTSHAVSLYDRSLFLAHGRNPADFDTVVVKSPHCQPQFFEEGAHLLIHVDAPGSTSANLKSLGHTRCARPLFPLDDHVTFTPKAKIFRRDR
ncbi:MAG TPA: M81 family metallopeptidase [Bryobacteraceae bacterium]|nr:M81 family metallopeptidase [Bryobacteraceae bacterium]